MALPLFLHFFSSQPKSENRPFPWPPPIIVMADRIHEAQIQASSGFPTVNPWLSTALMA